MAEELQTHFHIVSFIGYFAITVLKMLEKVVPTQGRGFTMPEAN